VFGYVLRRLLLGIPTLLGVTLITFMLLNVFGGDPVATQMGKNTNPADVAARKAEYGLDKPLPMQYLRYLQEIVTLEFGRSFVTRERVSVIIGQRIGPSLSITIPALILTTLVAVLIALVAAFNRGRFLDRFLMVGAVLGMSISFLVYIVAGQYLLAFKLGWFQIFGYDSGLLARWQFLALPILVQVIVATGYDVRYYRAAIVEETTRLHVKTALAKGLPKHVVLLKHVLRNSLIPIISRVMISVPFLITGSLLVETYFGIPGLGLTVLDALNAQDYPLIKAITVLVSVLFILGNILTDVLYSWADPRVRLK
jgi:peptide/nickel transport system permease protein